MDIDPSTQELYFNNSEVDCIMYLMNLFGLKQDPEQTLYDSYQEIREKINYYELQTF